MAAQTQFPLVILPSCDVSRARVECMGCGGTIPVDMRSPRVRQIVAALADRHECPGWLW